MGDYKKYWVGFNLVKGIGPVRFAKLLDAFGSAEEAWLAPADKLRNISLPKNVVENLLQTRNDADLDKIWEQIGQKDVQVLTLNDDDYPERLKNIPNAPPLIFVKGAFTPGDDWSVAIVGTRKVSHYGRQTAEEITRYLVQNGITIVSGLARGVDGIAHQTAIKEGGRTIGVLGCGVDVVYPAEHRRLAIDVANHGAIVSDFPLGTKPDASNFPPRNRIIAGLAKAVIIIEAGKRSGALITASYAAEQGIEVFAVPGNIYAPQSKGTNHLIRMGAHPLTDPKDVLDALNMTMVAEHKTARTILPADAEEARLYNILDHSPKHVDELKEAANMPIEQVTATLAMMELKGMVKQVGGMQYIAVRDMLEDYS